MYLRTALVVSALLALGCTPNNQEQAKPAVECTLVGCSSGIVVHLPSRMATTFRVYLAPAGGSYGTTYSYDCTRPNECLQDIMFPDIITESARVTVTTPAGSRLTEIPHLLYTRTTPNGPRCGPECRRATILALLPE